MDNYASPRTPGQGSSIKRDSFAAQLDQDPTLSSSRRAQKADLFSSRMASKSLERRLIAAENAKQELEIALKEKEIAIERISQERRWLADREIEEREEKTRLTEEWAAEKKDLDRTVRTLRTNLNNLQTAHDELEDEYADLKRTTTSSIASQKASLATLERKVSLLEDELERTRHLAEEHKDTARNLRDQVESLESQQADTSRMENGFDENWQVIREEMHRQTAHWKSLESTNAKLTSEVHSLRAKQQSVEVLREENRSLQQRLLKASQQEETIARLQGEVDAARREREEWAAFLSNPNAEPTHHTPTALTTTISRLRLEHASLLEEHGSLSSILAHRDAELASLKSTSNDQATQITRLTQEVQDLQQQLGRRDRRVKLLERENQGLKALQATYDAEEVRFGSGAEVEGGIGRFDEAKAEKLQILEQQMEELKQTNADLEQALEEARARPSMTVEDEEGSENAKARIAELEAELAESMEAADNAADKLADLEQQLFELGATINAGNHVPPNTRVLQFTHNPIAEDVNLKRDTFERLRRENEELVHRLGEVEQGLGVEDEAQVVPRSSWQNIWMEKEDMVKAVADKEKRLLRLKQVFTAKTEEFRQTVESILGFTLFFQPTKIRLTSAYNLSAAITFQLNTSSRSSDSSATMKLLGAGNGEDPELDQRLVELIEEWIVKRDSIPCFMAALTLECYERMYGSSREVEGGMGEETMQMTRTVS
ncbi:coiled-coil domain-containing protein mad1 [Tulasnella sp. 424]|nr:coiled-coil domain-containing protein mad1 [Tulasnella sp. 424]KAG8972716.1 coiled-coil domain-containing protein mad1 [Tulasnella sp. 425]